VLNICSVLLLLFLALVGYAEAQDHSCDAIIAEGTSTTLNFLREQTTSRSSPCIAAVIYALGKVHSKAAIPVLLQYLDYVDPATGSGPRGGGDTPPRYPAVTALFELGTVSSAGLLQTIQSSNPR
jgi:hypothetical protein